MSIHNVQRGKGLIVALRARHSEMEIKRSKDAQKVKDLQTSIGAPTVRSTEFDSDEQVPLFPQGEIESVVDTYTTISWKSVYSMIDHVVAQDGGISIFDKDEIKVRF